MPQYIVNRNKCKEAIKTRQPLAVAAGSVDSN